MVPPAELIGALVQSGSIRVMHTAADGDHVWTLNDLEKDNLRKLATNGQL